MARETRIDVRKTYKLYIGGAFPRTESGRSYLVSGADGSPLANACRASRKDVRDAVRAARKAADGWADRTARATVSELTSSTPVFRPPMVSLRWLLPVNQAS